MLIFDIGANNGNFTDNCLKSYPDATIVSIEANDSLIPRLKNRFYRNDKVHIVNKIVSNKSNEIIDFHIGNQDTISTASREWITDSRFANNHRWDKTIRKQSISLDDLIKQFSKPDIIKIDVEGYELEVIHGLSEKQKDILFEWTEEGFKKTSLVCEHLIKLGYSKFGYTYEDHFLQEPTEYTSWENCKIHTDIVPERKKLWGMIWAV